MLNVEIKSKAIRKLNLDYVIEQLLDQGYDLFDLLDIEKLYKKFLDEKLRDAEFVIVPTKEVAMFWNQHILNTKQYTLDCKKICGKYIHREVFFLDVDLKATEKILGYSSALIDMRNVRKGVENKKSINSNINKTHRSSL